MIEASLRELLLTETGSFLSATWDKGEERVMCEDLGMICDTTTATPPSHHHSDITIPPPQRHHHLETLIPPHLTPQRHQRHRSHHHCTSPPSRDQPPQTTATKTKANEKGLLSFKNLSPPRRSVAAVENTVAAPKKLLHRC
nr:hypothetical protein [Tanacetum cinerariifolium]